MATIAAIAGLSALLGAGIVILTVKSNEEIPSKPVIINVRDIPVETENIPNIPTRRINVHTRGEPPSYQQVGYLSTDNHSDIQINNILPLYGRQTYNGSQNWNYFTKTEAGIKIPITINGKDCTEDVSGCKELYDHDSVDVDPLNSSYNVKLYNIGAPRYLPDVF